MPSATGRVPSPHLRGSPLVALVVAQFRRLVRLMKRAPTVGLAIVTVTSVLLSATACGQSVGQTGAATEAGAEGRFSTTADGRILDPAGREFVPLGANVSIDGVFDWGGTADGQSDVALAWGWNTVRLNVLASDALPWSRVRKAGYEDLMAGIDEFVSEYTDKRIVVILDSHDLFMIPDGDRGVDAPFYGQINRFWSDAADRYKDNPYVWFNLHNEPPVQEDAWYEVNRRSAEAVRDSGARNPIVVDAQVWGQDLGEIGPQFVGAGHSYDPGMAPRLSREFGDVILSQHNYGSYDMFTDVAAYSGYVDRVRAAGLPLLVGEFGMKTDGVEDGPKQADFTRRAVDVVAEVHREKQVGALWWHANHTDGWSLFGDDTAFFEHEPGTNLSEGGAVMWGLRH